MCYRPFRSSPPATPSAKFGEIASGSEEPPRSRATGRPNSDRTISKHCLGAKENPQKRKFGEMDRWISLFSTSFIGSLGDCTGGGLGRVLANYGYR